MSALIELIESEAGALISSRIISENVGVEHRATTSLIRKHRKKLETLGSVTFEMSAKSVTGQERHALLNEDQAIFVLTLSRNTKQVVEFKLALTKAFSKLRRKQALIDANHANAEWQQNRELGKLTHRNDTDTIKMFLDYASIQGSTHYLAHGYSMIARMINSALDIQDRDEIDEQSLHLLSTAELICDISLKKGMADGLPYKVIYQQCKRDVESFAESITFIEEAA